MARREAYITGIGQSEVGVRLTRHPMALTRDAVKEALDEAGLTIGQIDGVASFPGRYQYGGFSPLGADEVADALGIQSRWHMGGAELTAQIGVIGIAAAAIRDGLARHILCFRTVCEAAAAARPEDFPPAPAGSRNMRCGM